MHRDQNMNATSGSGKSYMLDTNDFAGSRKGLLTAQLMLCRFSGPCKSRTGGCELAV